MSALKPKIKNWTKADLAAIETALEKNLTPYLDLVSRTARHILFSGGKRFRPLLMVLAARICEYGGSYDKTLSITFEYLHAATLLHDDLVDGATLRRGKAAAHSLFGNEVAILVGDFLFARALSIAAQTDKMQIIRVVAKITELMSQGEIHQLTCKGMLKLSEAEYMEVIHNKTAMLIEGACRVGAILADADSKKEAALSVFGINLGLAFQIADDLLDYMADTHVLGKEIGADLKEGKLTLPVIYTLKKATPAHRKQMQSVIKKTDFSDHDFKMLLQMLQKYGGLEYAKQRAADHISTAKESLAVFGPSETKTLLLYLADYVIARRL